MEDDNVDHEGDIVCETSKEGPETPRTTDNDPSPATSTSSRRGRKMASEDPFERAVADFISNKNLVKNQEILIYSFSKVSY